MEELMHQIILRIIRKNKIRKNLIKKEIFVLIFAISKKIMELGNILENLNDQGLEIEKNK